MRVIFASTTAVVLAMALAGCGENATSAAQAAGGEAQGQGVAAVGCPAQPKAGCVTIAAGGKTYDITDAGVDMSKGVGVSVTGQAKGEVGACGPKLAEVKVDYLALQCAAPAPPAAAAG
ncbi:hypothetical protein [Phenylobacterium sp.]|jgi:hypothetical protein|uniref:hypothetical protein n=1 Tax=Phenylobacterium sp. TaxID=1871053 RepID=UPI002F92885E